MILMRKLLFYPPPMTCHKMVAIPGKNPRDHIQPDWRVKGDMFSDQHEILRQEYLAKIHSDVRKSSYLVVNVRERESAIVMLVHNVFKPKTMHRSFPMTYHKWKFLRQGYPQIIHVVLAFSMEIDQTFEIAIPISGKPHLWFYKAHSQKMRVVQTAL